MSTPTHIDYVKEGLDKLLEQFKGKEKIEALLTSYLTELDNLQADTLKLMEKKDLNTADGVYLDNIGKLVGSRRAGADDETYRRKIKLKILINNSEGTPAQVTQVLELITEASKTLFFEHPPLNAQLSTDGSLSLEKAWEIIKQASPICSGPLGITAATKGGTTVEPFDFGFRFSETAKSVFGLVDMVDELGNPIVDQFGNRIRITAATGRYTEDAVLEELPGFSQRDSKPFAELYDKNRLDGSFPNSDVLRSPRFADKEVFAASGAPNKEAVPDNLVQFGISQAEPFPRPHFNYQVNLIGEWLDYLYELLSNAVITPNETIFKQIYPVGAIWITESSDTPDIQLGFGTWVQIKGKMLVGYDDTNPMFDTVGSTGGSKIHTHSNNLAVAAAGDHSHKVGRDGWGSLQYNGSQLVNAAITTKGRLRGGEHDGSLRNERGRLITAAGKNEKAEAFESLGEATNLVDSSTGGDHTHTISGGLLSSRNLPPYRVVKIWKRIT